MESSLHELAGSTLPLGRAAPLTAETVAVQSRQPIPNVPDFEKRGLAALDLSRGPRPALERSVPSATHLAAQINMRLIRGRRSCPEQGGGRLGYRG